MIRINTATGEEIYTPQIKEALPNVSFGTLSDLSEFGFPTLIEVDPPIPEVGKRVVRGPNQLIEGQWTQTWIQEDPPPAPIPQTISRAQGKAVLIQMGLWPSVVTYIENIVDATEKELAKVALNDTQEWKRDSAFLNTAATALGLTSQQMDQMFIQASQIDF